jgi:hypothetical protein
MYQRTPWDLFFPRPGRDQPASRGGVARTSAVVRQQGASP